LILVYRARKITSHIPANQLLQRKSQRNVTLVKENK